MNLPDNSFLQFLIHYGYWIAVPVMIVEGPIATIVMSFFASFGYFNPLVVLTFSFLADLTSDSVFYAIGRYNGDWFVRRFGKYLKLSEKTFGAVQGFYDRHGGKSIFLAKILSGLVPPVFIVAGYSRMKLKKFYGSAALGGLLWSTGLVALGYFFGARLQGDFANIGELFTEAGLAMFGLLALFFVYRYYLHTIIERKLKIILTNGNKQSKKNTEQEVSGQDR